MRTLVLAALALSATASAGTLTIEKRGLMPGFVWVDGEEQGRTRNRRPMELELDAGEHEVWIAIERGGTVTRCYGLVDVPASGATVSLTDMHNCDGLRPGFGYGADSAFRGSSVDFTISGVEAWVQIDGSQQLALPSMPFLLNLDPGTHTIILWRDVSMTSVFDQGTVTLEKGERLPVTCTLGGCMGFNQPAQKIEIYTVIAPASSGISINVDMPSIDLNVTMPSVNMDVTTSSSSSTTVNGVQTSSSSSSQSSGNANLSCCINGSYYECPTSDAVYQCSGAFMVCMMDCGMMDMDCPESCLNSHPMDPSQCSRTFSGDATCSQ